MAKRKIDNRMFYLESGVFEYFKEIEEEPEKELSEIMFSTDGANKDAITLYEDKDFSFWIKVNSIEPKMTPNGLRGGHRIYWFKSSDDVEVRKKLLYWGILSTDSLHWNIRKLECIPKNIPPAEICM